MTRTDTAALDLQSGSATVLYGPAGSGSSRFMRAVAGIDERSMAEFRTPVRTQVRTPVSVDGAPPRCVALVLGDALMFPHMTVRNNLSLGPQQQGLRGHAAVGRVLQAARAMGAENLLGTLAGRLSALDQLRAALARGLSLAPDLMLLGNVLQAVPEPDRAAARGWLQRLHQDLGLAVLHATHDRRDALLLGSRIAWMQDGKVEQSRASLGLYEAPPTRTVAAALGIPPMNLLRATLAANGEFLTLSGAIDLRLHAPWHSLAGGTVWFGVRPEHLRVGPADERAITLKIDRVDQQGPGHCLHGQIEGQPVAACAPGFGAAHAGDKVWLHFDPLHVHWFDIKSGDRLHAGLDGGG